MLHKNKLSGIISLLSIVLLIIFIIPSVILATTYYSQGSANFGTLSNWNTARDGSGGNPAGINSTDDFVIQNGHTITNDGSYTINSLTIENGGTYDGNGNTIVLNGNFTQNGTMTDGVNPSANFTFSGSATQTIGGTGTLEFYYITFNGTGTYTISANFSAYYLTLSGGTLNAGSYVISIIGFSATVFNKTGGTFNAGTSRFQFNTIGSQTISSNSDLVFYDLEHSPGLAKSLTFSGDVQFSVSNTFTRGGSSLSILLNGTTTLNLNSATLIYSGSVDKTVSAEWPTNSSLAPSEVQITSGITVTADPGAGNTLSTSTLLLNASGAVLQISSGSVQVNTQLTMTSGSILENGGTFAWGTGTTTLLYNGTSQQNVGPEWTTSKAPDNVQVNNSSGSNPAVVMGSSSLYALSGNLTLTYGSLDYSVSGLSLTVSGDVEGGSGSFGTVNSNTLLVDGASSAVTSSGTASFYNLTITSVSGTLSDIKISGTLTVNPGSGNTTTLNGAVTLETGANLTVSSGILNLNGQLVTKTGSNTLTLSSGAQLTTGGSSIVGFATYSLDPASTILFNGASSEDIPAGVSYGNIEINKTNSSAIVSGTGTTVLQDNADLTVTAGTFDLNALALQLGNNSDLNVQGGILDLNGGSLSITLTNTNNLTIASGATLKTGGTSIDGFDTYTASGTVIFNGSTSETIPSGMTSFNDLTINNGAGVDASNSTKSVSGTLTLSLGTLTPATLNLSGTLTTDGGNFSTSTGTVVFQGSSAQTINGTSAVDFYNFTISNASGVTLNHNITVYGTLYLSGGVIDANGNLLSLTTGGSFSGGSSSSYVEGRVAKTFALGSSATFTFHTAKGGQYLPVGVAFTDVSGSDYTVTVEQYNSDPHSAVSSSIDAGTLSNISSVRYWFIDGSGGTPANLQITLTWNSTDGVSVLTALDVAQFTGTQWISVGGDGTGDSNSGTIQSDVITTSGSYYTFGDDAAGGQDNSLPVTLSAFKAEASFNKVVLEWTTESEIDNLGFNIYRKTEGSDDWQKINQDLIPGAGNSSYRHDYRFVDQSVTSGAAYSYRLESVSYDGSTQTFNNLLQTVKIPIPTDFVVFPNFPNPFNPETTIKFQLPETQTVSVLIFDIKGNLIKHLIDKESLGAGEHQVKWNATDDNNQQVSSGTYIYRFVSPKYSKIGKMVFLK
ncbi:MAG: hypothetical protein GXO77_04135 [Calditrichaeota bacterium]|nr:hypothetical protein [Calditrichota bacterium]